MCNKMLSYEELSMIGGGDVCSIIDVGCLLGESIKWGISKIPKRNGPLNCHTVGVTAYTCN